MKKLYLMLVMALVAMAANAADWYLVGDANSLTWNDEASCKFTPDPSNPDIQTLHRDAVSGQIKIKQGGTWTDAFGTNGAVLKEGEPYAAKKDGSDNIQIDGIISDATLTINTSTYTLTITGTAKDNEYSTIYLNGSFAGWESSNTDYPLTLKAGTDNVWEGKFTFDATAYFRFTVGAYQYGPLGDDQEVGVGQAITVSRGSDKAYKLDAGEYTFSFVLDKNAATGTLTITGQVVYPELFVRGGFNSWGTSGGEMTCTDGVYTAHFDNFTGEFVIADSNWASKYANGNTALALDTPYELPLNGNNMAMAKVLTDATFTFDYATKTLTVTGTAVEYPELYVRGAFNGWGTDGGLMDCNEGIYTLHLDKFSGEFVVANSDWNLKFGNGNTALALNTPYVCEGATGNMAMADRLTDATITFDYATKTLTVAGTVDTSEPVISYLLKGTFVQTEWADYTMQPEADGTFTYALDVVNNQGELALQQLTDGVTSRYYKVSATETLSRDNTPVTFSNDGDNDNLKYDFGTEPVRVTFTFNPATLELNAALTVLTGIEEVEASAVEARYFDLQGMEVSAPVAGRIYIMVRGAAATKIRY